MSKERVPKGYKQTDVGVIPEDWTVFTIGEGVDLINGRAFKPSDWEDYGLPIVRIQNLNNPEAPFNHYSGTVDQRYHLEKGDILFAWSGTKESSFGARIWEGPKAILNQHIFRVVPCQDKLSPQYTFLALKKFQEDIEKKSHGFKSSFVHVRKSDLESIYIAVPPFSEQYAIASTLSDIDNLLSSLDRLIAKKRDLKQATMQQLLTGKKRLPEFRGDENFKQTDVGLIPRSWEIRALDSLGTDKVPAVKAGPFGSALTKDTYVATGYKVYGQEQVIRGDYSYGDYYVSIRKFKQLESCSVSAGDILLSLVGTTGKVLVVPDSAPPGIINPRLIRLSFDRQLVDSIFFKFLFESSDVQDLLSRISQGGTMGVLNAGMLKALSIGLPPLPEQTAIAQVLTDMNTELTTLQTRRAKTQALKQAMMQELLTGKTRLLPPTAKND